MLRGHIQHFMGDTMKALKWLFYLIVLVAVVIVGGSFVLPSEAVVTRSVEIAAPPEKVFAIVGDLRRFQEFSPWAELDPNAKYTLEGPEYGVGAPFLTAGGARHLIDAGALLVGIDSVNIDDTESGGARPAHTLLLGAGVYLAALFFRTIDNEVCAAVPIGTHFLWHLLIGSVTYLAMRPLILTVRVPSIARV